MSLIVTIFISFAKEVALIRFEGVNDFGDSTVLLLKLHRTQIRW
jgi:hypothetical protein